MNEHVISFGPFRLLAAQRLLLEGERPVRLGGRAFDILTALVERAGEVVGKAELMARAWPKTFVEEANLKFQVSALRRALGDGQGDHRYVVTVPGRGYNFIAPIRLEEPSSAPPPIAQREMHNLPLALARMIGREEAVTVLDLGLSRHRLVTIVGPGGVGKTTVALAVAEHVAAAYQDGVWLVDLAPLSDGRLVPSAVATVLGLVSRGGDPVAALVAALRDSRALLLLDNCEPVIDAAASLAAAILSGTPSVSILATSREPLRVVGEQEYRLGPLRSPETSSELTAAKAAAFPAVQLFVERVRAVVDDFALTDANAPLVAEICRRLDGLPLAIEFAAARVVVLGIEGLAARLDASLPLLATRRRTAMPRHQTMRAVLDWSYGLLGEDEQRFFRALAIFAGGLTIEAAAAVATDAARTRTQAINRLSDLVMKSLVIADVSGVNPRFRLLNTTRAYAIEKLDASGERKLLARLHAEHYRSLFERAEVEAASQPPREWLAQYAQEIDNLSAGLDWAFSPDGDASIGVALAAAAAPLWMELSLLEECRARVERALVALAGGAHGDARCEMKLHTALGASLQFITMGIIGPEAGAAWERALGIAESLNDADSVLRSLSGLWLFQTANGQHRVALALAQRLSGLAAKQSSHGDRLVGERALGISRHFLGEQSSAQHHLENVLAAYVTSARRHIIRFQIDPRVIARVFLARTLWVRGFVDQALRAAEDGVEAARMANHINSIGYALNFGACPIALLVGDLDAAERHIGALLGHAARHGLMIWLASGQSYQGHLAVQRGDVMTGLRLMRAGSNQLDIVHTTSRFIAFLMAEALGRAGQVSEGLAAIEGTIAHSEHGQELWAIAELLRIKGELVLLEGEPAAATAAEHVFRQALDWARRQGALSWELRAATSLARLWRDHGRPPEAKALLQPVYNRFTEGLDTADLKTAKALLGELGNLDSR